MQIHFLFFRRTEGRKRDSIPLHTIDLLLFLFSVCFCCCYCAVVWVHTTQTFCALSSFPPPFCSAAYAVRFSLNSVPFCSLVVLYSSSHRFAAVAVSPGYGVVHIFRLEGPVHRCCPRLFPATHCRTTSWPPQSPTNRGNLLLNIIVLPHTLSSLKSWPHSNSSVPFHLSFHFLCFSSWENKNES